MPVCWIDVLPARVAAAQCVVRHVAAAHLAAVLVFQIAEFAAQIDTAARLDGRKERRIPVRRDVPVIGQQQLHTAQVVHQHRGRQEARLALVRQREGHGRQLRRLHALELERGAFGLAGVLAQVQVELVGAEYPGWHPARTRLALAGRIGRVLDRKLLLADEHHAVGPAIGAVHQQAVARIQQKALKRLHLQFELRALINVARTV